MDNFKKYATRAIAVFVVIITLLIIVMNSRDHRLENLTSERERIESELQILEQNKQELQSELSGVNKKIDQELKKLGVLDRKQKIVQEVRAEFKKVDSPVSTHEPDQDSGYWLKGHDGRSKKLPTIVGNTAEKRFKSFVNHYALGYVPEVFVEARNEYGIPEELLSCIAWAETSLGLENKSANNIMNYGNNDSGDTRSFGGVMQNVKAAAHGLAEGTYLGNNTRLGELSGHGREILGLPSCSEKGQYCYATSDSKGYRRVNVYNCLTLIHGEKRDRDNWEYK